MSHGFEIDPKIINTNGVKNKSNITVDLTTILLLPNLLILLLLKYSDTRVLSVEEKSESTDFLKKIVLIKKVLIKHQVKPKI